jgi:hypothetical protein
MPGAMPWHHRYIGNPILTAILNLIYHAGVTDAHSGMRAFTREAYRRLNLQTTGMEFASEMIIKAKKAGLKIREVPITLYPDGRSRHPHLRSFRDGWRHLRFILLYSPNHLFLIPGGLLFIWGLVLLFALLPGPLYVGLRTVDVHFMVLGSLFAILGYQIINIGFYAKIYAFTEGFEERNAFLQRLFHYFNLEKGLLVGFILFLLGFAFDMHVLVTWVKRDFGALGEIRATIFASTCMNLGDQTIFSSFFLSILGIERTRSGQSMEKAEVSDLHVESAG